MPILENEDLTLAREALGDQSIGGDVAYAALLGAVKAAAPAVGAAQAEAAEANENLALAREQIESLTSERDSAIALSRSGGNEPAKPTATEMYFAAKAVKAARTEAISARAITPAVADQIEARFMRKPVKLDAIALSREVEADDHKVLSGLTQMLDVFESLKGNEPLPELGEQSGAQVLSRTVPGQPPASDEQPAYLRMANEYSGSAAPAVK